MRKRVATKEFVRRLRRSVFQNLISDLVRTSFEPRFAKALQWFAAWSAATAAAVVACAAASGQGTVIVGRELRDL